MSKYIVFQDAHAKGKNSVHRIGNYFEDWLLKFDEMLSIAKKENVDAIIDNGDLLHSANPSYRILDEIADRVEKAKVPILSLFGNHTTLYHSIEHSQYTGLSHLMKRSKYFSYLPDYDFKDMEVKCIEYSHDIEDKLKKENLLDFKTDKFRVGFIHAFVTPKPFLPQVMHVQCKDIKNSGDCLLFIGHYHTDFDISFGTARFLNIACFGRNSITEAKIEPKIAIIDTDKRSVEVILLKSAKRGEEVFDLSKVDEKKEFDAGIDDFVKSIESVDFQSSKIEDNVSFIAKEKNVRKEVTDLIFKKIKELGVKDE